MTTMSNTLDQSVKKFCMCAEHVTAPDRWAAVHRTPPSVHTHPLLGNEPDGDLHDEHHVDHHLNHKEGQASVVAAGGLQHLRAHAGEQRPTPLSATGPGARRTHARAAGMPASDSLPGVRTHTMRTTLSRIMVAYSAE
jgi:hypothetical protein